MLNPAEPNTVREIKITYKTDDAGEMDIDIQAEGFEEQPGAVGDFLIATVKALKNAAENRKK